MNSFIKMASGGNNHILWYVFTVSAVIVGYVLGQIPLGMVISVLSSSGAIGPGEISAFEKTLDFGLLGLQSWQGLVLLLSSSIIALLFLVVCIRLVHNRTVRSLVTSGSAIDWQKIFFAFMAWLILMGVAEGLMYLRSPEAYAVQIDWDSWIPLAAVGVLLIPLQTSFEEIFVRGYLMQGIGYASRSSVVAVLATSVLFALIHLGNPEVKEFGMGIMIVYYLLVAVFLAVITLFDNGLEYALGIHAATNIYGALFVSFKGSVLQTDTLIVANELNALEMLILMLVMILIFSLLIKLIFGWSRERTPNFQTDGQIEEIESPEHQE